MSYLRQNRHPSNEQQTGFRLGSISVYLTVPLWDKVLEEKKRFVCIKILVLRIENISFRMCKGSGGWWEVGVRYPRFVIFDGFTTHLPLFLVWPFYGWKNMVKVFHEYVSFTPCYKLTVFILLSSSEFFPYFRTNNFLVTVQKNLRLSERIKDVTYKWIHVHKILTRELGRI